MAVEINIIGMKKLGRLRTEFNASFPYLGINIYSKEEFEKTTKGEPAVCLAPNLTIAKVRTVKNNTEFKVVGHLHVGTFEARMRELYGLFVQVMVQKGGEHFVTGVSYDKKTLQEANDECPAQGFDKYTY
ncbi:MAG: hypothetical protein A3K19_24930 [Lentisphaerae bacterium RIFOXYB12_FULL_65_16]|nr:MAG: hypothetical protein A3K18_24860 [Lentisphaerae bacterium RIFOXYA12_64_32]OGV90715.1 MAG: hypothetical protein A3K19_24930 [Lentisphaerae bacterium RIFOXYB12_FULL_65_16]